MLEDVIGTVKMLNEGTEVIVDEMTKQMEDEVGRAVASRPVYQWAEDDAAGTIFVTVSRELEANDELFSSI